MTPSIFISAANLWESRKFAEDGLAKSLEECWTVLPYKLALKLSAPLLSLLSAETRGFTTTHFKSLHEAKSNSLKGGSLPVLSSDQRIYLHATLTSEDVSERLTVFCTGYALVVDPEDPPLPFTGQVYQQLTILHLVVINCCIFTCRQQRLCTERHLCVLCMQ